MINLLEKKLSRIGNETFDVFEGFIGNYWTSIWVCERGIVWKKKENKYMVSNVSDETKRFAEEYLYESDASLRSVLIVYFYSTSSTNFKSF